MKCTFCGQTIDKESKYCPVCGYLYKVDSTILKDNIENPKKINKQPNKIITSVLTFIIVLLVILTVLGLRKLFEEKIENNITNQKQELSITSEKVKNFEKILDNEVFAKYVNDLNDGTIENSITPSDITDADKLFIVYENIDKDLIKEEIVDDKVLYEYELSNCFGNCFKTTSGESIQSVSINDLKQTMTKIYGEKTTNNFNFEIDYESETKLYILDNSSYHEYIIISQTEKIEYSMETKEAYKEGNNLIINQEWIINDTTIQIKQIFKLENDNYYWYGCELSN